MGTSENLGKVLKHLNIPTMERSRSNLFVMSAMERRAWRILLKRKWTERLKMDLRAAAAANIGVKTGASPVITSLAETKTKTVHIANTAPADMRARTARRNTVAAAVAGTRRKVAETRRKMP